MTQAKSNRFCCPNSGILCHFSIFGNIFSKNLSVLFVLLFIHAVACSNSSKAKSSNSESSNSSISTSGSNNSGSAAVPAAGTGFTSLNEFRELLGNDPAYQGFVRCLNTDALVSYVNVRAEYDFVFLVPNEINQDPVYAKKYWSEEADPRDRLNFWISHMTVSSKGIPWLGNPSIYEVMLKRDGSIISYPDGSANIIKEKTLKDGTQVIFIDKPIKINVRQ
ncbi:MAG: hypothetical protein HOP11_14725 [Saprospiraceae bacterium]|nr:hypothetical protein [Saprospiraceae bacterium]